MMRLPPFSENATCPKCGHDEINCRWRRSEGLLAYKDPADEWLSRCCKRCGFIWDEACLEHAPSTQAPSDD